MFTGKISTTSSPVAQRTQREKDLSTFNWRQHVANLDKQKRQRQTLEELREMKNRQQEIQNEFFELEKAMVKLSLLTEREERRKDSCFRRCGAIYQRNQFVCGNKLNKSKGYENVLFCGKHQNRNIVHILDDCSVGDEVYWRETLI